MKKFLLFSLMQLFAFVMFAQTLESPKTKVVTMDPAPGHYDVLPDGIVLTFSDKIEILESGILRTDATDAKGYMLADADYTITDNTLTLTLPKEYLAYNAQAMLKLQIKDVNGQYVTYGDIYHHRIHRSGSQQHLCLHSHHTRRW